jgi:hypothetical protein
MSNPAPNTAFVLQPVGWSYVSVIVNEQVVSGNGTSDTERTVNAIHARVYGARGLLRGEVIVIEAFDSIGHDVCGADCNDNAQLWVGVLMPDDRSAAIRPEPDRGDRSSHLRLGG